MRKLLLKINEAHPYEELKIDIIPLSDENYFN